LYLRSYALNPSRRYITGTAEQAIEYTAGGSTIDWLQSIAVTAFVLESVPPCDNRWCPQQLSQVLHSARQDGVTARRFVELVVHGKVGFADDLLSPYRFWMVAIFTVACCCWWIWKKRHGAMSAFRRRLWAKEKQVPETELQSLTSSV